MTEEGQGDWQRNYGSIDDHAALVEKQFLQEEKEGLMARTTLRAAMLEYKEALTLAATGAIEKKGRTDEVRVIYDGSNGIFLNPGIRVRDQVRFPTAADGRAVLEECAHEGGPHFSLHYDIAKAHRQVPVLRKEWGRQACQIMGSAAEAAQRFMKSRAERDRSTFESQGGRPVRRVRRTPDIADLPEEIWDEMIWLNCVGTFGVALAGYWWGRAGAAVERLTHYLQGPLHALWQLLYSDDGWATGRAEHAERDLLFHLFVLVILGTSMDRLCSGCWTFRNVGHGAADRPGDHVAQ